MKTNFSRLILSAFIIGGLIMTGCDKDNGTFAWMSEARYTMTITGKWNTPAFTVPGGAHYTTFVGMIHNADASLWKDGTKASLGTEQMAEIGNGTTMLSEIDSMNAREQVSSLLLFTAPDLTASKTISFYTNTNYSHVSFISMLGPTPDWFIGLSGYNLYKNDQWVTDTTINLYAYDAGTEEGDIFNTNNLATVPQQNIGILPAAKATVLANGNSTLGPIATVRFTKK